MYLKYYNLSLKPFEISPDPKFLWLGEKHKEALAAIKYGILDNKGFISLTGDVGTGKTTLVNALANSLGENIIFGQVSDPSLEQLDFLNLIADAFKMNKKFSTKGDFLSHLKHFLNNAYVHHKEVVLVIEEAQRFDQERLEEVRLISNIEKPDKKLINIVFVGQNEFNSILKKNKALRQRHAIIHNIEPLQKIETEQYVMHRLKIAGSERKIFSPEAVREIYSFSEGNPRLINIICDFALLTGYAKEKKIIEPDIIRECAENYLIPKQQNKGAIEDQKASAKSIPEAGTGIQPATSGDSYQKVAQIVRQKPAGLKLATVTPIFVVILLSIFGYLYFFGENHAPYRDLKTFLGQAVGRYNGSKSETSSQKPDETTIQQSNIAGAQVQALDLKTQNTSIENQLVQLKSHNEELRAALEELKGAKERVVELEREVPMLDTMLSQSQLKLAKLAKELNQEKQSGELLSSELSSKVDLIAELREKLGDSHSNALEAETKIENITKKINVLQENLLNLKTEKVSAETQLGQLKSRNEALTADLAELKGVKERVADLEGVAAVREEKLTQSEQKVTDLATALDQEKKSLDQLRSELSTKTDLILDLKAQKTSSDTQLGQLKSRNEELAADLAELKGVKERVAELEGVAAMRAQTLSQSGQKVTDLTTALDREKKGQDLLRSELSTKTDLVAGLEQKLAATLSNRAELENGIEKSRNENTALQAQLLDLKAQKTSSDIQLGQMKSRNEALTADLAELKGVKERVAELEGQAAMRAQTLSQSGQKVTDLTSALDREKKGRDLLRAELSTKSDLVAELEHKLEATLSSRAELENDLDREKTSKETLNSELSMKADLVAELEQKLAATVSSRAELENNLDQEKESRGRLSSELSSKENRIAELQVKLANAQSNAMELEAEINNSTIKINELQAQLGELKTQQAQTVSSPVKEIAELQSQLVDLKAQKASFENQLEQLRSSNEELTADMNELKGAGERVAALEGELATKDQALSGSEQRFSQLAKEFDQEKQSRERLSFELSSKEALIAEMQVKLANAKSNAMEFEAEINNSTIKINKLQAQLGELKTQQAPTEPSKEIVALQGQLLDLKAQKTSSDTQLGQLKSRYDELTADLEELKGAKERVTELEGEAAMREQTLSQSEQKVTDLAITLDREKKGRDQFRSELSTKADLVEELEQKLATTLSSRSELENDLDQEKKSNDMLRSELSSMANLVEEFQQNLKASKTSQLRLENDIEKSKKEIAELQNQIGEHKAQQTPTESSPAIVDVKKKSTSKSEPSGEQGESPSPSDIIDWVLKKKAK